MEADIEGFIGLTACPDVRIQKKEEPRVTPKFLPWTTRGSVGSNLGAKGVAMKTMNVVLNTLIF